MNGQHTQLLTIHSHRGVGGQTNEGEYLMFQIKKLMPHLLYYPQIPIPTIPCKSVVVIIVLFSNLFDKKSLFGMVIYALKI